MNPNYKMHVTVDKYRVTTNSFFLQIIIAGHSTAIVTMQCYQNYNVNCYISKCDFAIVQECPQYSHNLLRPSYLESFQITIIYKQFACM